MVEFWRGPSTEPSAEMAEAVEAEGWDGQRFMDSQSLGFDPYVSMGAWAMRTSRLKLSPGVTNPFTRRNAVTAASIASLQALSTGRASLGIGRGDSALAYLGHAPVTLAAFEQSLVELQTLLSGGEIPIGADVQSAEAGSLETLSLGDRPAAYRLGWLPKGLPKVPLDVAATGPKVIQMAAVLAEQITFSVGAMVERLRWAMDLARSAREQRGLPPDGISFGAQIIVVCHPDRETALEYAASSVAPLARFQIIQRRSAAGPTNAIDDRNYAAIRQGYDMNKHADKLAASKLVGDALTPEFIERFAIVGPPDRCIERLRELIACGLDRVVAIGPGKHPESMPGGRSLFAAEVMPALRREFVGSG